MVTVETPKDVKALFIEWNGWGPPSSEYQIYEFCREKAVSEEDSNRIFTILLDWMNS